jgi:uncharacterized membrane protein (DUF2068 family)
MAIERGIRLIAFFKLFKGVLLLVSGVGLLRLLHKDVADAVMQWINILHADPDNRHIQSLLIKASIVTERQLKELSIGSFFYAGLLLTEGSALLLQKRWAKYFTVIVTASFIPLELWELAHRFSVAKTVVIAVNVAIVWYLVLRIKHD